MTGADTDTTGRSFEPDTIESVPASPSQALLRVSGRWHPRPPSEVLLVVARGGERKRIPALPEPGAPAAAGPEALWRAAFPVPREALERDDTTLSLWAGTGQAIPLERRLHGDPEADSASTRLERLRQRMAGRPQRIGKTRGETRARRTLDRQADELAKAAEESERLRAGLAEVQTELERLRTKAADESERRAGLESALRGREDARREAERRFSEREAELESLREETEASRTALGAATAALEDERQRTAALEDELRGLREAEALARGTLDRAEHQLEGEREEIERLRRELEAAHDQAAQARSEREAELESLREETEASRTALGAATAALEDERQRTAALEDELRGLREAEALARETLDARRSELDRLGHELEGEREETERLRRELEAAHDQAAQARSEREAERQRAAARDRAGPQLDEGAREDLRLRADAMEALERQIAGLRNRLVDQQEEEPGEHGVHATTLTALRAEAAGGYARAAELEEGIAALRRALVDGVTSPT